MVGAYKCAAGCPGSLQIRHFDMNVGDRREKLMSARPTDPGYVHVGQYFAPRGLRLNMFIAVRMSASDR